MHHGYQAVYACVIFPPHTYAPRLCAYWPHIGSADSYFITDRGEPERKAFPHQDVLFCSGSEPVHQNISGSPLITLNPLQYSNNVLSEIIVSWSGEADACEIMCSFNFDNWHNAAFSDSWRNSQTCHMLPFSEGMLMSSYLLLLSQALEQSHPGWPKPWPLCGHLQDPEKYTSDLSFTEIIQWLMSFSPSRGWTNTSVSLSMLQVNISCIFI